MAKEEKDRTGMVERDLTVAELSDKGEELAHVCRAKEKLEEKKRTHNRKWNEELIQYDDQISVLSAEVETGKAWVPAQNQLDFAKAAEAKRSNGAADPGSVKIKGGRKGKTQPEPDAE